MTGLNLFCTCSLYTCRILKLEIIIIFESPMMTTSLRCSKYNMGFDSFSIVVLLTVIEGPSGTFYFKSVLSYLFH